MKKAVLSIIILLSFSINFNANSHVEHYAKFNYLEYELFRNNKSIGFHKYEFIRENNKISKLGVDIYKYYAVSEETYKNNEFFKFSSKTNQNKKEKYVNISVNNSNDHLIIDGTSYKGKASKDAMLELGGIMKLSNQNLK